MIRQFDEGGVRFRYPANWQPQREETDDGWTVTVHSPDTAFFLLSVREGVDPQEMAETVLAALREEYPDLDAEPCVESVARIPAVGHDVRFFSLDLTNTCRTRCLATETGAVLVLCQYTDMDAETHDAVLRAIVASLELED